MKIMPSPNDIVNLFSGQHGVEHKDVILDLNELLENIKNPSWSKGLEENRDEYAERTFSCPKCGEPLEIIDQWKESRGEMCGKEVYEEMQTYGCTSCGYIKE
jgi:predicted RNA-binding Zn-ribbon protein involved in translation (DUF1610 family)